LRNNRSTIQFGTQPASWFRNLLESDLHFVHRIIATFIDARCLTGRSDKQTGKQIRQRRMIVPESNEAAQQIRTTQKRTVARRRSSQHQMISTTGARVTPVHLEFFSAQSAQASFFINGPM
jgi:hypothetical protein